MSDCIECPYSRNIKDGNRLNYGQVRVGDKMEKAHRVAWEKAYGAIPEGLCVLHKCDNPPCVNPEHLFLGTHKDNATDREAKGRGNHPQGADNGRARISEITAVRLKKLNGAVSASAMARALGMTVTPVWKVMTGRAWQNVTANTRYVF
jgi:hypothetical protein